MPKVESACKILLIDDDTDFITATKMILENRGGYKVITAGDGTFGLALAKCERQNLIILDILMPFENGFETAEKLKNDPELGQIPIIMLTSFSQRKGETDVAVSRGLGLETEDYIEKPIKPDDLLRRISRLLNIY